MNEQTRGAALDRVTPIAKESERSPMGAMKQLMQQQPDLLNMAIGEANFDPPRALVEIASRLMLDTVHRKNLYTSTRGLPSTRAAIARFIERIWGVSVDPEQHILMTVGAMEALHLAIRILVDEGDTVLLPDPGWGVMVPLVTRRGGRVAYYPLAKAAPGTEGAEPGAWTIDAQAIIDRMDASTKVVVVNSPSNPTGAMLSRAGWDALIAAARVHEVVVITDEVYHNYVYGGTHASGLQVDPALENVVMVNSFSKAFAIMGWRMGYVVAHPWLIQQMDIYKESVSACSFSIGQWAIAEYLDDCAPYLAWAHDFCEGNMRLMVDRLRAIPGVEVAAPQGSLYVFADFSALEPSSATLTERLLKGGLAISGGSRLRPPGRRVRSAAVLGPSRRRGARRRQDRGDPDRVARTSEREFHRGRLTIRAQDAPAARAVCRH